MLFCDAAGTLCCAQEYQETQKKREEQQLALEKERREQDRLEQLKKKDVRQQSAVASTEVKQRLQVRPVTGHRLQLRPAGWSAWLRDMRGLVRQPYYRSVLVRSWLTSVLCNGQWELQELSADS